MNAQRITTSISYEEFKLCQENNWSWADLIRDGMTARLKPSVMHERLTAQQAQIEAMQRKIKAINEKLPSWARQI